LTILDLIRETGFEEHLRFVMGIDSPVEEKLLDNSRKKA
jgi:hypothetical protein